MAASCRTLEISEHPGYWIDSFWHAATPTSLRSKLVISKIFHADSLGRCAMLRDLVDSTKGCLFERE